MEAKDILDLAIDRCSLYSTWQMVWFTIHYSAGLLAITAGGLATVSAAKDASKIITKYLWLWGLLASLLAGVVTFLEPLQKAQTYKRAYYDLALGVASYNDGMIDAENLREVVISSQDIVISGRYAVVVKQNQSEIEEANPDQL